MSALGDCLAGKVTESELFTDGVDMVHELRKLYSLQKLQTFPHSPQSACLGLGLDAAFVVE